MGRRESPSRNQQPASPITWTILDLQRERGVGGGRLLLARSLLVRQRGRAINHRGATLTPASHEPRRGSRISPA